MEPGGSCGGGRSSRPSAARSPKAQGAREPQAESGLEVGGQALQEPESSAPERPVSTTPQTPPCPKGCVALFHSGCRNRRWAWESVPAGRWGQGGAPREPRFVRDAPGSHAPGARASSRGPGASERRAARAAAGGLARLGGGCAVPVATPSPHGARCACRRLDAPGTSGLRVGVGVPEGRRPVDCSREAGVAPGTR